jgi:hypothetical protein
VLRWKMCPYCGTSVFTTPLPGEVTTAVATLPGPSEEPELTEAGGRGRRPTATRN